MSRLRDHTANQLRVSPAEGRHIVTALGGTLATMDALGVSRPTARRYCSVGAVGAAAAALRLAYAWKLEGYDPRSLATTEFGRLLNKAAE